MFNRENELEKIRHNLCRIRITKIRIYPNLIFELISEQKRICWSLQILHVAYDNWQRWPLAKSKKETSKSFSVFLRRWKIIELPFHRYSDSCIIQTVCIHVCHSRMLKYLIKQELLLINYKKQLYKHYLARVPFS